MFIVLEKECDLLNCTVVEWFFFCVKYCNILAYIHIHLDWYFIKLWILSILKLVCKPKGYDFPQFSPFLTTFKVSVSSLKSVSAETIGSPSYVSCIAETLYKILEGSTFKLSNVGNSIMVLRKRKIIRLISLSRCNSSEKQGCPLHSGILTILVLIEEHRPNFSATRSFHSDSLFMAQYLPWNS